MNFKELASDISKKNGISMKQSTEILDAFAAMISQQLQEGNSIHIANIGTIETKQKGERVAVNPVTKERFMVPAKLSVAVKPTPTFKERIKSLPQT